MSKSAIDTEITCKATLLMAIGLNLEHSRILSDIIDQTVVINLAINKQNSFGGKQQRSKRHLKPASMRRKGNSGGFRKIEKGRYLLDFSLIK